MDGSNGIALNSIKTLKNVQKVIFPIIHWRLKTRTMKNNFRKDLSWLADFFIYVYTIFQKHSLSTTDSVCFHLKIRLTKVLLKVEMDLVTTPCNKHSKNLGTMLNRSLTPKQQL